MPHLTLVALVLMLPALVQAPAPDLQPPAEDPCVTAREIAARGPCLRPEDCGAFEQWTELYGTPRTRPLDPDRAARGGSPGAAPAPHGVPRLPNCLAGPSAGRR